MGNNAPLIGCLPKGTQIHVSKKKIKDITKLKVGDKILAFRRKDKKLVMAEITGIKSYLVETFVTLRTKRGKLTATPSQRAWIKKDFRPVENALKKDFLRTTSWGKVEVESVDRVKKRQVAYHLRLNITGNFFANGFLVKQSK